ncbi:branched-chain amino acid ABC transporter permease [Dehalogenimonas etheniformans]|uniref:Branched-chain amino acid ABC transporter permease n=1 Tax=Dehalogenimonas etheniformans TaxID=1536648 RepID=A0A2P5P956_9CHLR|nr:branched-chain amino acid ABC transporter permease [Dehalogenimonas etheniformans]PPD58833.1 branched-chain amino acid ABC transporter permease [Dehalogenimonas etheniformans]QNT76397.1 branched-chain amino acid ABC transporter permease [Dehalogenimonas etheniformans]
MALPCGTRNFSYAADMAIFRTKTQWALLLIGLAVLFTAPLWLSFYWLGVVNLIGITIIAATGLNLLTGYCGQLSVGHAGFIAVGAFTSAVLTAKLDLPFLVTLPAAGLLAGLIGIIFGVASLRVKGFYLAISTIAAQIIILWVINHLDNITGGFMGMAVPRAEIFGFTFKTPQSLFFLIMTVAVMVVFFAKNLARTRIGRAFVAIRDNDLAAEVMGINLFRYKLLAFFLGCFLAGVAGSLTAHWVTYVSAEQFSITESILYVGMIIIGGAGTTLGPVLGAIIIRLLQQGVTYVSPILESTFFGNLPSGFTAGLGPFLFGLVIVLFLVLEPRGLAHRWNLFKASYRLWPFSY